MLLAMMLAQLPMLAQTKTVKGTVVDQSGEPIIGASIRVDGTQRGVVTDLEGKFRIETQPKEKLTITYVGFLTQTIAPKDNMIITLREDSQALNDVVVIGYGTQKKATLTGAVSAINEEELKLTKTQDTKNMLTGKVAGVRVVQNTSEPGDFGHGNFDIRGFGGSPLIVVDGVPRGNLERLDPNEVESISVLKDASAAIYGVRGGNGVILITTKKGDKGKAKIEYNMYYGIQTPAEIMKPVGAIDRMTLFNEKSMRSLTNPRLTYTDDRFELFRNGTLTSTDWYDEVLSGSAPQQQHNVSISGGTDKIDYFVNFGYMDQKGFLKSNDMDYNRYNLRANLNAQVTKNLKMGVRLGAIIDKRSRPYTESWEIFKFLWRSVPDESVYANNNPAYLAKPSADIQNPVGAMQREMSGYKDNQNKVLSSTFDATYTIPFIKGLSLKGLFSYDNTISDNSSWRHQYNEYTYDTASETYGAYGRNNPTNLNRYYGNSWSTLWQAQVNYDNTFGKHHVAAQAIYEEAYTKGDNISATRNFSIPLPYLFAGDAANQEGTANANGITDYSRKSWIGRLNYDFAGKYLFEAAFRYDGSSKFAENNRWGFFPSVQAGWRVSEENFIKNSETLSFIDNLKIRASWGEMGDDSAVAYQFVSGYDYPNTSGATNGNFPKGYVFNGSVTNTLGFRSVANPNITWYTIRTANIGLDLDMWKGLLGLTFEMFLRNRDGLLASRISQIPGNFGSTMPQENLNSDRTKGIELELRHRNKIGDFHYNISGNISLTRSMNRYVVMNPSSNSYANWQNRTNQYRYNDIWFGWGDAGRYTSIDQIAHSDSYGKGNGSSSTLPGDYIYEDWNHDGVIDDMDKHPIATTLADGSFDDFQNKRNYPLLNFGITIGADWKGFDLNMLWQGAGMSYIAYGEQLSAPLLWDGNALDLFLDRWHPNDPNADPYDPSQTWTSGYYAYGAITPDNNSEFMIQKGNYLRLKSIELGYTLPKNLLSSVGVKNLRIYINAYNLLTITGVKGVDPEKPANLYGYMYPLNRSYNFGLNVTF